MIDNNELINQIKSYNRFLNIETVNKAYNFALEAHQNQKRDEGVPYIIHPVAVAKILTELKLDSATITTGLLHDTIEDTNVTFESVKKEFGEEVANLVDGVTKISALENRASDDSKAENFRKLILATSKDIRVLLVKLADSYAVDNNGELYLINSHIPLYRQSSYNNHDPKGDRKLLLKRKEINKLIWIRRSIIKVRYFFNIKFIVN